MIFNTVTESGDSRNTCRVRQDSRISNYEIQYIYYMVTRTLDIGILLNVNKNHN